MGVLKEKRAPGGFFSQKVKLRDMFDDISMPMQKKKLKMGKCWTLAFVELQDF